MLLSVMLLAAEGDDAGGDAGRGDGGVGDKVAVDGGGWGDAHGGADGGVHGDGDIAWIPGLPPPRQGVQLN